MYIYIYMCIICVYVYTYMYICIYVNVYMCICRKKVYIIRIIRIYVCLCVCAYVGVAKIPACSSFSWSTFQLDRATAASLCRGSTSPTRASWIPKRKRPQNSIGNSLWYGYSCSTRLKLRNSQIIIDCYLPKMMPILPNSLQDCTFGANMQKKTLVAHCTIRCWVEAFRDAGDFPFRTSAEVVVWSKTDEWGASGQNAGIGCHTIDSLEVRNRRDEKTLKHLEIVWAEHRSLQDVCFDSIRGSHQAARKWHSEGTALNCWFDYCRFALAWAPVANLL